MAAAELTPSVVQKENNPSSALSGTPLRIAKYLLKITKATQNDWIVVATHCPGTFLSAKGWTLDGSGNGAVDPVTYTNATDNLVLTSVNVGTEYLEVTCSR